MAIFIYYLFFDIELSDLRPAWVLDVVWQKFHAQTVSHRLDLLHPSSGFLPTSFFG